MQESQAVSTLAAGTRVNERYVIKKVLRTDPGKYLIADPAEDKTKNYILKTVPEELLEKLAASPELRKELMKGTELSHPNVGPRYFFDVSKLVGHFFAFEKLEGVSLGNYLQSGQGLLLEDICYFLNEIAKGLAYGHAQGLVHRNLHPEAVFVGADNQIKVSYFGMSGLPQIKASQWLGRIPVQPIAYLAPEEVSKEQVNVRTDIYSLGILGHHLFFGEMPFGELPVEELCSKIISEPLPSLSQLGPEVPENIVRFVDRATAKDPAQRYASMEEVLEELSKTAARPTEAEATKEISSSPPPEIAEIPANYEERAMHLRVGYGLLWFLPVFILSSLLVMLVTSMVFSTQLVAQYGVPFMQSGSGKVLLKKNLWDFAGFWWPIVVLSQMMITGFLSLLGDLPGTGKYREVQTALSRSLKPKKPMSHSEVPGYIYFVCGWPIMMAFLGGALGGFFGALAGGSSVDIYRRTRSVGLGFLSSILFALIAVLGWALIMGKLLNG